MLAGGAEQCQRLGQVPELFVDVGRERVGDRLDVPDDGVYVPCQRRLRVPAQVAPVDAVLDRLGLLARRPDQRAQERRGLGRAHGRPDGVGDVGAEPHRATHPVALVADGAKLL